MVQTVVVLCSDVVKNLDSHQCSQSDHTVYVQTFACFLLSYSVVMNDCILTHQFAAEI